MRKPITIVTEVPDDNFNYSDDDAKVIADAVRMTLMGYVASGGDLDVWTIEAEPVELHEFQGIRLTLDGRSNE